MNVDIAAIENRIAERKKQDAFRLPSTTAVRNARRLMTYQAEKKVAEEMFYKECAFVPDGTGQKVNGKIGGGQNESSPLSSYGK